MRKKTAEKLLKKVVNDYNMIAEEFDQTRKSDYREFDKFLPFVKDNKTLVDLGCGNGRLYGFLKDHRNIDYLGIDNNKKLLERAKENYAGQFIHGDLLNIPVEDKSADIVACIAAFHHIPSVKLREKALSEISRILKNKGLLILSVWNLYQPKYKKYLWKAYLRYFYTLGKYDFRDTFIPWSNSAKRYYYAFRPHELESLFEQNGYKVLYRDIDKNLLFICEKK